MSLFPKNEPRKEVFPALTGIRALGAALVFINHILPQGSHFLHGMNVLSFFFVLSGFLIAIPTAIFYFGLICERSVISRLLGADLFDKLGKSSYAFYLLHMIVITYVAQPYILPSLGGVWWLYAIVVYALTSIISFAIYTYYEQPLNKLIRRNAGQMNMPVPQPQSK